MKNSNNLMQKLDVLYVEDDNASREQINEIFQLLFHHVDTAVDGEDAFNKYKTHKYDIVITDINMPKMNGIQLIEQIKSINPTQNIIIISAHNNTQYLLSAINLGVDNFIIKPVQMQQLNYVLTKTAKIIHAQKLALRYKAELEKEVENKTKQLAMQLITDELTGTLNRIALIKSCKKDEPKVILLTSIDNFDSINITYGYDVGDILIKEIAFFLQSKLLTDAELYRVEADKFAIVATKKSDNEMVEYAHSLQENITNHNIQIKDFTIKVSFTMAIASGKESLLKNSYIALKEAYKAGGNRVNIYTKNSSIELLQLRIQKYMPKLKQAIAQQNINPYFQPIVNNRTKKIEKYECLARITENNSVDLPSKFIDIAELTGMIPDITKAIIDKSFKTFEHNKYKFSINISEFDLNDDYLFEYLQAKLNQYNIDPTRVILEVLEGISTIGAQKSLQQLMDLKALGFAIAIDDFGAQNSNFERVHSMNVDYIKIDGSFIKNLDTNKKSYNIVKTISDFTKSIGAKAIAEYVHSKEIQEIVLTLGIEYSQGYYFSKPLKSLQ